MTESDLDALYAQADKRELSRRISKAKTRWYRGLQQRHRSGMSLLPYWVPSAYFSQGRSQFAASYSGTIELDGSTLHFVSREIDLPPWPVSQVRVTWEPRWLGLGVKVRVGPHETWYVQPGYNPSHPWRSHKASVVFKAACAEVTASLH